MRVCVCIELLQFESVAQGRVTSKVSFLPMYLYVYVYVFEYTKLVNM